MLPLKCISMQWEQSLHLNFVSFSTVATASKKYELMCLAHLHKQEQYSYPSATLLQLHCCRHLVHAILLDKSKCSGQIEDDYPCGITRETKN
eukprot:1162098-Pelagomonas_calceolata.AAC.11